MTDELETSALVKVRVSVLQLENHETVKLGHLFTTVSGLKYRPCVTDKLKTSALVKARVSVLQLENHETVKLGQLFTTVSVLH